MRREIAIVILFLCALGWAMPSSAEITMFWRAEGTTLDEAGNNDYALGDSTASAVGSPAINTTAVKYGTNGIHINAVSEYYQFTLAEDFVTPNAGAIATWIQWITFPTDGSVFFVARGDNGTNYVALQGISTDELRLVTNTGASNSTYDTTDANISTSTWYFVCIAWNDAANTRKIYLWDSAGTAVGSSPWIDSSTNFNAPAELTGANARLRFGESFGGTTTEFYEDNIFVGNSADDCPTFHTNRAITAYSSYSAGGGGGTTPRGMLLGVYP